MGALCCRSAEVAAEIAKSKKDRDIEARNKDDAEKESHIVKLLLLGAGESGKSTLLKQFRVLYGAGFGESERRALLPVVQGNALQSIRTLLTFVAEQQGQASALAATGAPSPQHTSHTTGAESAGVPPASGSGIDIASTVAPSGQPRPSSASSSSRDFNWENDRQKAAAERVMGGAGGLSDTPCATGSPVNGGMGLDQSLAADIALLWGTPVVQRAYQERSRFQLLDSAAYFLDRVQQISQPGYVPSVDDVVRTRVRTTGIIEERYSIEGQDYSIFDVGGQRNERRKWIHCFADVTAIIFVAAISEYDQCLYEENTANRLMEAIDLFGKVCTSKHFENTPIVLFLNKKDLFEGQLRCIERARAGSIRTKAALPCHSCSLLLLLLLCLPYFFSFVCLLQPRLRPWTSAAPTPTRLPRRRSPSCSQTTREAATTKRPCATSWASSSRKTPTRRRRSSTESARPPTSRTSGPSLLPRGRSS